MILSQEEERRYIRQIHLKQVDFEGQEKLKNTHMLIVGLGGLGCVASQYLATAGVGHLTLLDFDTVSLSNLQRQILYDDDCLNQPKVYSAKESLHKLNPHIRIDAIHQKADDATLSLLIEQVHVVLDCTDNLTARNQLDRLCANYRIPLISGAAIRMEGLVSTFTYEPHTPTYQSLSQFFCEVGQSCVETGVLAPIVGVIGAIQALEAIKVRLNIGKSLCGRVLLIDGLSLQTREITLTP